MTLIVAVANDDIGFMVGDTVLTPLLQVRGNPVGPVNGEFHGLKIQILDGKTAIAFASSNASNTALNIIANAQREIQENAQSNIIENVVENFKKRLASSGGEKPDCEFLVLRLEADGKRLAHITATGSRFCERAYIGDAAQYARMTKLRKPFEGPREQQVQQPDGSFKIESVVDSNGLIEFIEIGFAVEALVQQREKDGVGAIAGNIIRVCVARDSGELEYFQTHEASLSAAEGQAGFSLLASNAGVRGIGIYYVAGKLGFILAVGDPKMCRKEAAESIEAFKQIAKQKYGLQLA